MWQRTWEDSIGKNCLELDCEPWHAALHDRDIELAVASRQSVRGEAPFDGGFGRRIYEYIVVPVFGPDGEVEAIAGTTRDATDRKQAEQALEQASQRKDEFLAMLVHELRNRWRRPARLPRCSTSSRPMNRSENAAPASFCAR